VNVHLNDNLHVVKPCQTSGQLAPMAKSVSRASAGSNKVTLIDTGDFCAMGHNVMLIGEGRHHGARDALPLSVKRGVLSIAYDTGLLASELVAIARPYLESRNN
jgi:hypothetical protein